MFSLSKTFQFESAHFLPFVPDNHKCRRIHGHSFKCIVQVKGSLNPKTGWVIDYSDIKEAVKPIIQKLDHYFLNEIKGLENPTSEKICEWMWSQIEPKLPLLNSISIAETCESACTYHKDS